MVPQLGHLRNAFSLRSFHIFLAVRAWRLKSAVAVPAAEPVPLRRAPAFVWRFARNEPPPGSFAMTEWNQSFSRSRAAEVLGEGAEQRHQKDGRGRCRTRCAR